MLKSYSGHQIRPIGQTWADVTFGKEAYIAELQIVKGEVKPIPGKQTCERVGLLRREMIVKEVNVSCQSHNSSQKDDAASQSFSMVRSPKAARV